MTRPTDRDAALEADLAAIVPVAPSAELRRRVAEALAESRPVRPARARWLGERLLWACGGAAAGAIAASLAFAPASGSRPAAVETAAAPVPSAAAATEPAVEIAEEAVAWADAGVQFIDDRTPARIFRRVAVERHRPAGGPEYRVPREDVILMPVALR